MFPKVGDIELKQMSQNSMLLIPLGLFCENSAAFTFLSDSPKNPGRVFFLFQNVTASCTLYQEYHFIRQLFSQPIIFSTPISLSLETYPSQSARRLRTLYIGFFFFFLLWAWPVVRRGKYGIKAKPCGLSPKSLEFRVSELNSGECLTVEGTED